MFQFRRFPSYTYLIQYTIHEYCPCVFPHSDISGSSLICSSPKLFAACHVLHRLLMPRHSPCALFSLTFIQTICLNILVLLNYAGSTRSFFRNRFYPLLLKFSTICFFESLQFPADIPSVALLFICFVFSIQFSRYILKDTFSCTLKIEQCK